MMRRCKTGSNRIRGILPPDARVENKTGTLNNYTSDVGYLTTPTGRRIAVAFFARGGENRPAVIATAARMIYDAFGADLLTHSATVPGAPSATRTHAGQVGTGPVHGQQPRAFAPAAARGDGSR
jgi:beta-lactamase class A